MKVQEAIQNRLSIRQYAEVSIPPEHLEILFKALAFDRNQRYASCREFAAQLEGFLKNRPPSVT